MAAAGAIDEGQGDRLARGEADRVGRETEVGEVDGPAGGLGAGGAAERQRERGDGREAKCEHDGNSFGSMDEGAAL